MSVYSCARFFGLPFVKMTWPTKIVNKEKFNIPDGAIVICNHFSKVDGLLVTRFFKKNLHILIKKEAFEESKISNWFLRKCGGIPVNRGSNDIELVKTTLRLLKNNEKVVIFPEGTRNKTGTKDMLEFHDGVAMFAVKTQKPIIPMILYEKPRRWKKNYLFVGDPFELTDFYNTKDYAEATKEVFNHMVEVQKECNEYVSNLKVKKK